MARITRTAVIETLSGDYVRTARAKGAGEGRVLLRHALRNALLPIVTLVGLQVGNLLGGAVVTEQIYSWPGVGRMAVGAIFAGDFPLAQGAILVDVYKRQVRAHAGAHPHGRRPALVHQRPGILGRQMAVDQAIVLREFLQVGGRAMARQVVGRRAQHPADRPEPPGDEAGAGLFADQHGQADALFQQVDGAVQQMQVERDLGMLHQELRQQGLQMHPAVQRRRRDAQPCLLYTSRCV